VTAKTAAAQLRRLLYIIPAAGREGGTSYSALAEELGVDVATIDRDVRTLAEREAHLRAGELGLLQIRGDLTGDHLAIDAPPAFSRPPRLNREELLALLLGLRSRTLLRSHPAPPQVEALARRLEEELSMGPFPHESEARPSQRLPLADASPLLTDAVVRDRALDAMEMERQVTFRYLKPGKREVEDRRLDPFTVVHAEGAWYLLGRDPGVVGGGAAESVGESSVEGLRAFRLDRILDLEVADEGFRRPPDFDARRVLAQGRVFFQGDPEEELTSVPVRYSPRIARWIRERFDCEELEGGGVRVVHQVASRDWLVRHVLQYAGEAVAGGVGARWVREALQDD
jgi:predicted DNA-binding transcriptional regulator YafY